jgi:MinD-like ATPase involved in chromosome partitioning or flagellar assembly
MCKMVIVHSFLQALGGKRVGIIDMNIPSPSLHLLLGLGEGQVDYGWSQCQTL